ncbi:hypothetical protein P4V64_30040, partial [Bacillus thuringiensis]|nr:hypothetical protein [Bacillus thuringiensis]
VMKPVKLVALDGKYCSYLFNGELYHSIDVNLSPFDLEGNECIENPIHTTINIAFLKLPGVRSWRDLENKAYEFTDFAYEDYEIPMPDASVYLSYYHSPVCISKMEFGERTDRYIRMSMNCEVDFENGEHGIQAYELSCLLEIRDFYIDYSILIPTKENLKESKNIAKQFITLDDYKEPEIIRNFLFNVNDQDVFEEKISFPSKIE